MPGLIGFTDKHRKYNEKMLLNMRDLLKHFDNYVDEELYSDKNIYASRTHLGIINQGKQPYIYSSRFFGWLEGEFYNQNELKSKYDVVSETDNELLFNIYDSTRSFEFLRNIDGYYVATLYDKKENKVYLITDRYGFRPLYWGIINDDLVWSSEVKGFLGHIDFKPAIDRQGVGEFFDIGYLLEDRTWFEGIELISPASVLTFDIQKSKVQIQHYWSWNEIKPMKEPIDQKGLVEELGRLFIQSVCRHVNNKERIGITLSGGLDSRAILAAVPEDYRPLHTFTFGQEDCHDIRIASRVSKIKGAIHHILELNSSNWLMPRINGVWKSDALFSLLHMHGIEFYDEYKSYTDFNLNGFAGDLLLGGSYLRKFNLDKKINSSIVKDVTHSEMVISNFNNWYMINKTDPYFINNRVRRFTNCGLILIAKLIEIRMAFWSNKLIDFVYSIPDVLRYNSYIYNKMLLSTFPKYYNDIPWQKTGRSVSCPKRLEQLLKFKNRVLGKLKRKSQRFGFNFKDLRNYTDYPSWIRQEPARSFFGNVLLSKNALYPEYIDKNKVRAYIRNHMERKANYHNELCLALTFELWLQQVFEERYRDYSHAIQDS